MVLIQRAFGTRSKKIKIENFLGVKIYEGESNENLKSAKKNLLCTAVGTVSHQQGLEARTVRIRSGNAGCMTSAEQCKHGCSLGSMHEGGTAFCHPFLG
jgi:hypothetical protein